MVVLTGNEESCEGFLSTWQVKYVYGERSNRGSRERQPAQHTWQPSLPLCLIRVAQEDQEVRTVTSQTTSHPFFALSISSCLIKTYLPSYGRGAFMGLECNHWDTLTSPELSLRGRSTKQLTFWKKSSPLLPFPSAAAVNKNVYI